MISWHKAHTSYGNGLMGFFFTLQALGQVEFDSLLPQAINPSTPREHDDYI
jgi:hypothetical protein